MFYSACPKKEIEPINSSGKGLFRSGWGTGGVSNIQMFDNDGYVK